MSLIKQRECNEKKQKRILLRKRKRYKKQFLKDIKNCYINNEDAYYITDNILCCYTIFERVDLAKSFLDNNKIIYKITPNPDKAISFVIPISSFRIVFNKDLIKELEEYERIYGD